MPNRKASDRRATFDVVSCHDMLDKLGREIDRIKTECRREHVSDHGTNAALTAWHMADWVWADINNDPRKWEIWQALAAEFNTSIDSFRDCKDDELKKQVVINCRGIKVCQAIATASKHVGWDTELLDLTATGSARSEFPRTVVLPDSEIFHPEHHWILKLLIDGQKVEALPLFIEAQNFWRELIERHHIVRPS